MRRESINLPYLVLTGVILLVIVVSFIVLLPLVRAIQAERALLGARAEAVANNQQLLISLDAKIATLLEEARHERQLAVAVPFDDGLEDVTRIIHLAGVSSGVVVTNITNSSQAEAGRVRALRARGQGGNLPATVDALGITVQLSGAYQQVRVFLDTLEKSARLTDVTKLKVQRPQAGQEQVSVQATLRFYKHHHGS